MDQPPAMDGWPKPPGRLPVGAEEGSRDEQEAERDRPGRDPVGPRPDALRSARARTPACIAWGRRGGLDEHQAPSRTNFAHAAARGGSRRCAVTRRDAALRRHPFTGATALDPQADILDFSPPSMSLGCSWHRRDANSAIGG
jgi:hypothetical protein